VVVAGYRLDATESVQPAVGYRSFQESLQEIEITR